MTNNVGFHRILFAVNASKHSAAAVPVVAGLAIGSHADVRVLQLWSPDEAGIGWYGEVNSVSQSEELVSGIIEKLRDFGVSATGETHAATPDHVAAFIQSRADSFDADLIAVGNRGLSELHNFLIGSQTQRVLAQSNRPVLAVRNTKRHAGAAIRRVVLALGGNDDCASVLQACIDAARPASAAVEVTDIGNTSHRLLRAIADQLAEHQLVTTWESTHRDAQAARQIVSAVSRARADLLVIGATSSGGRARPVGNVVQRVLQSCPCPVLVAPPDELARTAFPPVNAERSGFGPRSI